MHATDEDLLRYVSDDLSSKQAQAMEEHVCECMHCYSRLREQAELEVFCSELSEQIQRHGAPEKIDAKPKLLGWVWSLPSVAIALFFLIPQFESVSSPPSGLVAEASTPAPSTRALGRPAVVRSKADVPGADGARVLADVTFLKFTGPHPVAPGQVTTHLSYDAGRRAIPCLRTRQC